jgi:hypothetical protein
MQFESIERYVRSFQRDPSLAVITVPMAAELFGISGAGINGRFKSGTLESVTIGRTKYVKLDSALNSLMEFDKYVHTVRKDLEKRAKKGQSSVEYGAIMEPLGMSTRKSADRLKIGYILGAVSRQTHEDNGTLLSVIVHIKGSTMPSMNGFFSLIDAIIPDWEEDHDSHESFVEHEIARVMDFYKNNKA